METELPGDFPMIVLKTIAERVFWRLTPRISSIRPIYPSVIGKFIKNAVSLHIPRIVLVGAARLVVSFDCCSGRWNSRSMTLLWIIIHQIFSESESHTTNVKMKHLYLQFNSIQVWFTDKDKFTNKGIIMFWCHELYENHRFSLHSFCYDEALLLLVALGAHSSMLSKRSHHLTRATLLNCWLRPGNK